MILVMNSFHFAISIFILRMNPFSFWHFHFLILKWIRIHFAIFILPPSANGIHSSFILEWFIFILEWFHFHSGIIISILQNETTFILRLSFWLSSRQDSFQFHSGMNYFNDKLVNYLKKSFSNDDYMIIRLMEISQFIRMLPFKMEIDEDKMLFFYGLASYLFSYWFSSNLCSWDCSPTSAVSSQVTVEPKFSGRMSNTSSE